MKIRTLSHALQEKAERELNEIPNQLEDNLNYFKSWLSQQEHLKYRNDDQLLVNFLRASKFSLQRAKEKLDAYYTFRTLAPEIGSNLDPLLPGVRDYFRLGITLPLPIPKEDPASPRVFLIRLASYDPNEVHIVSMLKAGSIIIDIFLNEDDNAVVGGCKVMCDMKHIPFKTAAQITPTLLRKIMYCYEKAFPTRLKAVYFINVPKVFEALLMSFKSLASKKFAERIHFYSFNNTEAIYKDIPKSILPTEYGGEAGLYEDLAAEWKLCITRQRDRLLEEINFCSDESKRPGTPKTENDLFGGEGSFRKLDID